MTETTSLPVYVEKSPKVKDGCEMGLLHCPGTHFLAPPLEELYIFNSALLPSLLTHSDRYLLWLSLSLSHLPWCPWLIPGNPPMTQGDPWVTQDDPWMTQDDPWMTHDDP